MPNAPLNAFDAFRAGTRTDASGARVTITVGDLAASAAAYDPSIRPAPLVIGHPKMEDPAYGWVGKVEAAGDKLRVVPERVEAAFAQLVNDGRYSQVSACFWRPEASGNPVPGTWYLKHVGFLGAHPPAVEGLPPVQFAAENGQTVEFGWEERTVVTILRRLREWIIGDKGTEVADQVIPSWDLDFLTEEAIKPATPAEPAPAFAAPATTPTTEENPMSEKDTAELERLRLENEEKDRRLAAFATEAAERRRMADATFVDGLIAANRVPAGHRDEVAAFLAKLDDTETVAFASGDGAEKETPAGFFRRFLSSLQPTVAFGEVVASGGRAADETAQSIADRAKKYQADRAAIGDSVSFAAAVDHVTTNNEVRRA
ncbi:peptidase [Mycobacterium sp. KBS0706]|uniref:peptidase n=1 Tax=Mycobacterium sp. KBS0706 TaxID=2578109 RepID=UPI00110FEFFA|nr:peptidase [Mycobacterium sp. KBS0706]TSD86015.1 peptidase [Mycobacterium sp. KBS0706]